VVWVLFIIILLQLAKRTLKKKFSNTETRYKSQKIVETIGYFLLVILTISYFTGNIKDLTLAIGLLTAGITISLQELILSVAGSLFICKGLPTRRPDRDKRDKRRCH
jgi:small-conductance mechanosensitive channel